MVDLMIYETGDGGDVEIINGDFATTDSLSNQDYLAHFGGNVEASTTGEEIPGEERNDWWGNQLFTDEPEAMMNSKLEKALNETSISSAGRSEIERRSNEDLQFLKEISEVSSSVAIVGNDKLEIIDYISEIETPFKYLWDGTKDELIILKNI